MGKGSLRATVHGVTESDINEAAEHICTGSLYM